MKKLTGKIVNKFEYDVACLFLDGAIIEFFKSVMNYCDVDSTALESIHKIRKKYKSPRDKTKSDAFIKIVGIELKKFRFENKAISSCRISKAIEQNYTHIRLSPAKCGVILENNFNIPLMRKEIRKNLNVSSKKAYYSLVRRISNFNYLNFLRKSGKPDIRSKDIHLDHRFSISDCFNNKVHPEIAGSLQNLSLLLSDSNCSKNSKSSITLNELTSLFYSEESYSKYKLEADLLHSNDFETTVKTDSLYKVLVNSVSFTYIFNLIGSNMQVTRKSTIRLSKETFDSVFYLLLKGKSKSEITKLLNLDKTTVYKILKDSGIPSLKRKELLTFITYLHLSLDSFVCFFSEKFSEKTCIFYFYRLKSGGYHYSIKEKA